MLQRANVSISARRAQWLAELAAALSEARVLLRTVHERVTDPRIPALEADIELVLREVDALRRGHWSPALDRTGPQRSMFVPRRPSPGPR